jgi:hypothetical protein
MFDIGFYLREKRYQLFATDKEKCTFAIRRQKNTADIYFCRMISKEGETLETVVLKHYLSGATPSLEYSFGAKYEESFKKQLNIRIPSYIYLDEENRIVVTRYVENSLTFEKYLLANRTMFHDKASLKWFRLAGRWLAHFHKVSSSDGQTTIDGEFVYKDLRRKWLMCFPDAQKMDARFLRVADTIRCNAAPDSHLSKMHREYGPGNILLAGDDLYGMDFGNQETAPSYDDISYFMIACATLNSLPHHPAYRRIPLIGNETREFINGYLDHYPFVNTDLFSDKVFILFLWKNLIRRISGKLIRADKLPVPLRNVTRSYLVNSYDQMEHKIFTLL